MIKVTVPLVDGSLMEWEQEDSLYDKYLEFFGCGYEGKALIHQFLTDDWGAPPTSVRLTGRLKDGQVIDVKIPYA